MSLPRPIGLYNFHADLIWWDGPFKVGMQLSCEVTRKKQFFFTHNSVV